MVPDDCTLPATCPLFLLPAGPNLALPDQSSPTYRLLRAESCEWGHQQVPSATLLSPLLVNSRFLWVEPHSRPRRTPLPLNYRTELFIHQPSSTLSLGAVFPECRDALPTFRTDCVWKVHM